MIGKSFSHYQITGENWAPVAWEWSTARMTQS